MRKGVSPVVAIVLLIAIAVIAAVAVWFWVSPLTGRPATASTTQKTISIEKCWVSGTTVSLLARNSGGITIAAADSFDIYDQASGVAVTVPTPCAITGTAINSGAAAIVSDATCTLTTGKSYFLRSTGYPDAPFTC